MFEIDLRNCTGNAETCGVVAQAFELDEVLAGVEDVDPTSKIERDILGNLVTACVNGNCPGMDLEFARKHRSNKSQ
jgi:hypothetical protein